MHPHDGVVQILFSFLQRSLRSKSNPRSQELLLARYAMAIFITRGFCTKTKTRLCGCAMAARRDLMSHLGGFGSCPRGRSGGSCHRQLPHVPQHPGQPGSGAV